MAKIYKFAEAVGTFRRVKHPELWVDIGLQTEPFVVIKSDPVEMVIVKKEEASVLQQWH